MHHRFSISTLNHVAPSRNGERKRRRKKAMGTKIKVFWQLRQRRWTFLICLLLFFVISATLLASIRRPGIPKKQLTSDFKQNISVDAVVIISIKNFRSTLLTSTLRTVGRWDKPIYVITDHVTEEREAQSADNGNVIFIDPKNHRPKGINPYTWIKWLKTQVFTLLPGDVAKVLYLDADIYVDVDITDFLYDIQQMEHHTSSSCDVSLYPERWYTNNILFSRHSNSGLWNSGIMMLHRQESAALLSEWSRLLLTPPYAKRDQPLLTKAIQSLGTRVCELPNSAKHVLYEADLVDRALFALRLRRPTFHHYASSKNLSVLRKVTHSS